MDVKIVTKETYNVAFEAIKEPLITTLEFNSLSLPPLWQPRDLIMNVKDVLVRRGLIGNELKKLCLYAETIGVDMKSQVAKPIPNSNVFIGGAL